MLTLLLVTIASVSSFIVGKWYGNIDGYVDGYLDSVRLNKEDYDAHNEWVTNATQKEWNFRKHRTN